MIQEMTTAQLAEVFHVTPRTIQRWIKEGKLNVTSLARDHYLIETDTLPTEATFKAQETRLNQVEHELVDIKMRVKRLEQRKPIVYLRLKKKTED